MSNSSLRQSLIKKVEALPETATLNEIIQCVVEVATDAAPNPARNCPEQWKLDVNDRYQRAVGVITSLATGAMVLPVVVLRDVTGASPNTAIINRLNLNAYVAWALLAAAVLFAIVYYFSSAKWVKLSWGKEADMFNFKVKAGFVERVLDFSYFVMMVGFLSGLGFMLRFILTAI